MIKLDRRDIQILSILQQQGRITKTALAEKVNLSPTPCWERLKRLEKAGVIEGYNARLCVTKIAPHNVVFMQAELLSHQTHDFKCFENALAKIDEVVECWSVGGGFDYLIKFMVKSIDHYQNIVDELLGAEVGLNRYYTYVVTRCVNLRTEIPESVLTGTNGSESGS